MTLRTRLLFGYALLVLLLVVTGVAGSYGFREISILVNDRLDHFTATTTAANTLVRTLERQERLLLQRLVFPERSSIETDVATAHEEFRVALDRAEALADDEQRAVLERILRAEAEFVAARDGVLQARSAGPDELRREYELELVPTLERVREPCTQLLTASRQHMFDARDAVREAATGGSVLLGVLVTVGLLSLIALARSMRTHVLERLDELRRFSEAIAAGERHQRAIVTGHDELARLATQMNAMLDQQDALEGRLEGRLTQDRQMLLGMLGAFAEGAILLSTGGDLITWSGGLPDSAVVDALSVRAAERNRAAARGSEAPDAALDWTGPDGSAWRVHFLRGGARAAGWLAEPVHANG